MSEPRVIVTGVGRTGTSAVARVLHEKLHICMSQHPDSELFTGYFEDDDFHSANRRFLEGEITFNVWRRGIDMMATDRALVGGNGWGFKDPRTSLLLGLYAARWPRTLWIWCDRPLDAVRESWIKRIGTAPALATKMIAQRQEGLENFFSKWPRVMKLSMSKWREDDWIYEQINGALHELNRPWSAL